jgi:hypothetical protein
MLPPAMASNPLPSENAFLVQLGGDVGPELERFSGRVEHLESGRRARFGSRDELLAAFAQLLASRSAPIEEPSEPEEK